MKNIGYYNGTVGLVEDMRVPMNDRVSYFGDGVYDATMARNHRIFLLEDHIERFYNSARLAEIPFAMELDALAALLRELVGKVEGDSHFVYWQLTRGTAEREHAFPDTPANLWAQVLPKPLHDLWRGYAVITCPDTRYQMCNIKTLNLLPNVIASQRAAEAGCDEAVFVRDGLVTECAHSNIHILQNGALRTAPLNGLILPGITRKHLIAQAQRLGVPVREEAFTPAEMMAADEVIFTSASSLCCPVDRVDGQSVGGRAPELLEALRRAMWDELLAATSD